MSLRAAQALRGLLYAVGHQAELDEEIVDYICSMLEDPDPESCVDVLVEVFGSAVPAFSSCDSEKQLSLVLHLLEQVREVQADQPASASSAGHDIDTVLSAFKQATLQSHQAACSDITNTLDTSNNSTKSISRSKQKAPDISGLIELCPPGTSSEFLAQLVQQKFSGDLQAAADYLCDCPDIKQLQQQWLDSIEAQEQQRLEAELEKQQTKKQLVARFDLQVVPELGKKQKYHANILPGLKKGEQQPKVRYRDGQVVSCKGEKYIIEKTKEEWDGGSKGKVYTKGKRGKGFV